MGGAPRPRRRTSFPLRAQARVDSHRRTRASRPAAGALAGPSLAGDPVPPCSTSSDSTCWTLQRAASTLVRRSSVSPASHENKTKSSSISVGHGEQKKPRGNSGLLRFVVERDLWGGRDDHRSRSGSEDDRRGRKLRKCGLRRRPHLPRLHEVARVDTWIGVRREIHREPHVRAGLGECGRERTAEGVEVDRQRARDSSKTRWSHGAANWHQPPANIVQVAYALRATSPSVGRQRPVVQRQERHHAVSLPPLRGSTPVSYEIADPSRATPALRRAPPSRSMPGARERQVGDAYGLTVIVLRDIPLRRVPWKLACPLLELLLAHSKIGSSRP